MRNKYNAKQVRADGYLFKSLDEYARYQELKLLERGKFIRELRVHPRWPISINGTHVCTVELDFDYLDGHGVRRHEDVNGQDNAMSRLKRKLVEAQHGITVTVVRMPRRRHAIAA